MAIYCKPRNNSAAIAVWVRDSPDKKQGKAGHETACFGHFHEYSRMEILRNMEIGTIWNSYHGKEQHICRRWELIRARQAVSSLRAERLAAFRHLLAPIVYNCRYPDHGGSPCLPRP